MKVSDTPWDRFAQYLIEGMDVFVGPESLIAQGRSAGAVGAVSALASAFPELIAAEVHASETLQQTVARDLGGVRSVLERFPFQSALKTVLARRGVPINPDVRRPLRTLSEAERAELETWLESSLPAPAR